ncbi:hypothetical protein RhiirA5_439084 [Rhizophagus irregularis]|uniref:Uncharacterized protein n=2 Tax=Rhizophagus irregularis TaxID=588596 RepID=A0A2N0NIA6_9GLOM|nr:hypothetical protein RhiirA5_439084 [Rhizophagus irregularis]GBC48257.1 hypothetical protein RIR_jg35853.t1 [Rhizophagus irregularis DAOM 181602=DAOM 197198]CAB4461102.1 unnamed protein product [Rhizophagus irregularis]
MPTFFTRHSQDPHKNHNLNIATAVFVLSYHNLSETQIFLERDVINAIQSFKQDNSHCEANNPDNNAFWLLEKLEN